MRYKFNDKRFFKQFIYYINRQFSERNQSKNFPIAGYSFDAIHHHINIYGSYEKIELETIERFLNENFSEFDIALDVGANIGNHTVRLLARQFTKVYCYEPNQTVFDLLSINTKSLSNVTCRNYGLSDEDKILFFRENKTNLGASFITEREDIKSPDTEYKEIEVRTLDGEKLEGKVNLIKVDIEGHEFNFLKGSESLLMRDKPIILFEEALIDDEGSSKAICLLKSLNYEFYTLNENFYFGNTKLLKLITYLLQDIFGIRVSLVKTEIFKKRFYHSIIAVPSTCL